MEPVNSYAELAPLLSAQLKRGVVTNNFLSRADWERELKHGVDVHAAEGTLVLLRHRAAHDILNVYLHPGAELVLPELPRPTVVELVWRPRDAEAVQQAAAQFLRMGFAEQVHRLRRQREPEPLVCEVGTREPELSLLPAVQRLLEQSFDSRTGCIPSLQELGQDGLLCTFREETPTGVLHYRRTKTGTELRHLAVRSDCRGQGLGAVLVENYLRLTGKEKSQVWAARENAPAQHLYEKYGYRPDGWESVVLLADGKEKP